MDKAKNVVQKSLFIFIFTLLGCLSFQNDLKPTEIPQNKRELVYNACFEIVVRKSNSDSLTYERELPWHLLPYNVRRDKYYSIGTAFAISNNELLTAFHVLKLSVNSLIFTDFYIRDSAGNVFEIDQITSFSQAKDYVKFTARNKRFDQWFSLAKDFSINEIVYSAGNAYGEGIILRKGNLIGVIPEEENGRWNKLRSSSDVNSGNSGGPLLNLNGDVIGIVIEKKDNIAYSLPILEYLNEDNNVGSFHMRQRFSFGLFPETTEVENFDYEIKLPQHYKHVKSQAQTRYTEYSNRKMKQLFFDNRDEIFPFGDSSLEALYNNTSSIMPQVIFKNNTDKTWNISAIKVENSKLRDNGVLNYADVIDSSMLLYVEKPDSISLKKLNSQPKALMDLILEGINFPRLIGNQEVRITSLGYPFSVGEITDNYSRTWLVSKWLIEFSDVVIITYSLPTPEGSIVLLQSVNSAYLDSYQFSSDKMLNFIDISFYGNYKEWKEYLSLKELIPPSLTEITINKNSNGMVFRSKNLELISHNSIINASDDTIITLDYDIFTSKGEIVWDIRRVVFSEITSDNFLLLYKTLRPDIKLRDFFHNEWNNTIATRHPFNNIPFNENGRTNLGKLLNYTKGDNEPEYIYSLFIAKEGRVNDTNMFNSMDSLDIKIWD